MNEDGKIEELKKKLYSANTENLPKMKHVNLHDSNILVNRNWEEKEEQAKVPKFDYEKGKAHPFIKGLFVLASIFVIIALAISFYLFDTNPNAISNANIDIKVSGPITIGSGQELSLDVDVYNNNQMPLEIAELVITYPEGTRRADDKMTSLITERVSVGEVGSNDYKRTTIKSIILAEEGATKNINITLEYKLPDTNSIFVKDKIYPVSISTGPVAISVESVGEITPEQNTKFIVSVKSNSKDVIKDVILKAEYPFGFNFIKSDPNPSASNNIWRLGDVAVGETKKIVIDARFFGQVNQERTIRFNAGTVSPNDVNDIGVAFASFASSINLKAPFLGADVSINGKGDEIVVVNSGQLIQGEIIWNNNLDVTIYDVSIGAKLNGGVVDRRSVNAEGGFYKSEIDTILWEKSVAEELESLSPNQTGTSHFGMKVFDLTKDRASNIRRPELVINFKVNGNRLNENKVPEEVISQATRKIRIASDLGLQTRLLYSDGPFENTGGIPPKVNKETTYTVNVKISNSYNTVRDVVYTAKLPIYVKWLDKVSPSTANGTVTYNEENRTITWKAGDVAPGAGYISNPKEMSYQVGFTPSLSQENQSPMIIEGQRISGMDSFTNTVVEAQGYGLNTQIKYDSKYNLNVERVSGE